MAEVVEDTRGKTRDLPIAPKLRQLLLTAAQQSGVDTVLVTSGGQCRKGTCLKRTGSERHDDGLAADLKLLVGGQAQSFTDPVGLKLFRKFVAEAAQAGATGIGAGEGYMGPQTIHVGFGTRAVWGTGGKSANAPQWLIESAREGWGMAGKLWLATDLDSEDEEEESDAREDTINDVPTSKTD